MTDQERRDLQEFRELRELWSELDKTNREKAVEIAVEMLVRQMSRGEGQDG